MKIEIRRAKPIDANDIVHTEFTATSELDSQSSKKNADSEKSQISLTFRAQQAFDAITSESEVIYIATIDKKIIGIASIMMEERELKAMYISPQFAKAGIGKLLLEQVEKEARLFGITCLMMEAPLSDEAFYKNHGFAEIQRFSSQLKSGLQTPIIKMGKAIF